MEKYGNKSAGVFIMRTEDYLTDFYPTCQSILELYYSLAAVNNEANESGKTECTLNLMKIILIRLKHPLLIFGSSLHNWNEANEFWSHISFRLIRSSEGWSEQNCITTPREEGGWEQNLGSGEIFCANSYDEMGSALWLLVLTTKFPLSRISVEKQKKMVCFKETLRCLLLLLVDFLK